MCQIWTPVCGLWGCRVRGLGGEQQCRHGKARADSFKSAKTVVSGGLYDLAFVRPGPLGTRMSLIRAVRLSLPQVICKIAQCLPAELVQVLANLI